MTPITPESTVGEARAFVRSKLREGGTCPCCFQSVKLYNRTLNCGMAHMLILIYKEDQLHPGEWIHISRRFLQAKRNAVAQEYSKLRFWGLLEPCPAEEEDQNPTGLWRITVDGKNFVEDRLFVARAAQIYDNKLYGFTPEQTSIRRALGDKFDYDELMTPPPAQGTLGL